MAQKSVFDKKEFKKLRHVNEVLQGHPDRLKTPGVEFNSSSLGQGFSFALGCTLSSIILRKKKENYIHNL